MGLKMKKIYSGFLGFVLVANLLVLTGCGQFQMVDDEVAKSERKIEGALATIAPSDQPKTPLKVDNRPWYGMQAVPITNGVALPAQMNQSDSIVLTFAEPVDLFGAAQMIQSVTGIRTIVGNNVYADSTGGDLAQRTFLPTGGEEVSADESYGRDVCKICLIRFRIHLARNGTMTDR